MHPQSTASCLYCQRLTPNIRTRYCSHRCKESHAKAIMASLSSQASGAVSELAVCTDLLRRGYNVFRSVSPHCSCDIVAYRDDASMPLPIRIEVKTVSASDGGKIHKNAHYLQEMRNDVIAAVSHAGEIRYTPDIDMF